MPVAIRRAFKCINLMVFFNIKSLNLFENDYFWACSNRTKYCCISCCSGERMCFSLPTALVEHTLASSKELNDCWSRTKRLPAYLSLRHQTWPCKNELWPSLTFVNCLLSSSCVWSKINTGTRQGAFRTPLLSVVWGFWTSGELKFLLLKTSCQIPCIHTRIRTNSVYPGLS